jgi:hypothetical protein
VPNNVLKFIAFYFFLLHIINDYNWNIISALWDLKKTANATPLDNTLAVGRTILLHTHERPMFGA